MFLRIQNFEFPQCEDENFAQLVSEVKEGFQIIQKGVRDAASTIKALKREHDLENIGVEPIKVHPGVYDIAPTQDKVHQ